MDQTLELISIDRIQTDRWFWRTARSQVMPGKGPGRFTQRWNVMSPLLVQKEGTHYQLIDGFMRFTSVSTKPATGVPCFVLDENVPPEDIVAYLMAEHRERSLETPVGRALFASFVLGMLGEKSPALVAVFRELGFQAHSEVFSRCRKIAEMSDGVIEFFREKNLAFKQCAKLAQMPQDLLEAVLSWRKGPGAVALSASLLEELVENINDVLRNPRAGSRMTLPDFLSLRDLRAIFEGQLTPQDRAGRLRAWVRALRYPTVTQVNRKLSEIHSELRVPEGVQIAWDPTLERREIQVCVRAESAEQWQESTRFLSEERTHAVIQRILSEL